MNTLLIFIVHFQVYITPNAGIVVFFPKRLVCFQVGDMFTLDMQVPMTLHCILMYLDIQIC